MHEIPKGQSISRIENLRQVAKSGIVLPELEGPEFPNEAINVWLALSEMQTISACEIESYSRIKGTDFGLWEIESLFYLDRLRHGGSR